MYKPAKHVSFDADKSRDCELIVRVNAVAAARGQEVQTVARYALEKGLEAYSFGCDIEQARRMMWPH